MGRLTDKIAIITGAADGVGYAISKAMVNEGAHVIMADIQDDKGQEAADDLTQNAISGSGTAHYFHCDVGVEKDIQSMVDIAIERHGKIDILVNNAAIAIGGMPIHEMTDEEWHKLMNVNLTSVFRGCKFVLPHMIKSGGGSIINMASAQGHVGLDGWTAYAGAKGAIMAMSRQMAVEFGKHKIRVNSISPGTINTPMNEKVVAELGEHMRDTWVMMHPIDRIGEPEEVAEAAVYLASDLAGFTTGMDLRIDGGLSVTPRYLPDFFKASTQDKKLDRT